VIFAVTDIDAGDEIRRVISFHGLINSLWKVIWFYMKFLKWIFFYLFELFHASQKL